MPPKYLNIPNSFRHVCGELFLWLSIENLHNRKALFIWHIIFTFLSAIKTNLKGSRHLYFGIPQIWTERTHSPQLPLLKLQLYQKAWTLFPVQMKTYLQRQTQLMNSILTSIICHYAATRDKIETIELLIVVSRFEKNKSIGYFGI